MHINHGYALIVKEEPSSRKEKRRDAQRRESFLQ